MTHREIGFTIVELLIVIVVIAILAAITVVSYTGIQGRAIEATVQGDLSNAAKKAELYKVNSTTSSYPESSVADLTDAGLTLTKSNYDAAIWCTRSTSGVVTDWALAADAKNGKTYYIKNGSSSVAEYTANKVQGTSGGTLCPGVGQGSGWGWQWLLQVPTGAWSI